MTLEPVGDYLMVSCSVAPGTVIPAAGGWTRETPAMLRDSMLAATGGRDPALVAGIGVFEQDMRDYVYPFMRMTMDHDRNFGGGALEQMG